jgi:uncharacterized protein DUF4411
VGVYWVDSDVFIQAKNGPYGFDIAPGFWKHLDKSLRNGSICSSEMVYRELVGYSDQLAVWVKNRKGIGISVPICPAVEVHYTAIANHVSQNYDLPNSNLFLSGADGWVIAHALHSKGTVVSQESDRHPEAHKVRIPDVCAVFSVRCIHLVAMLREQGASLK